MDDRGLRAGRVSTAINGRVVSAADAAASSRMRGRKAGCHRKPL